MGQLPYHGIRILESSRTLAGRLAGVLFADQGAEVFVERDEDHRPEGHDQYLDRGKTAVPADGLADISSADIIIVDGDRRVERHGAQIVLRIVAALPGDEAYGHLPADCSEDLLNALVGFYTDMATTAPLLGRPVIYTPLPLCSVYAGVNGAVAVGAALADRERCGRGREVIASRLAGGLSAIGVRALTSEGIAEHLAPFELGGLPEGMAPEEFKPIFAEASRDPKKQLWLEQRLFPLGAPYRTSDGRMALPFVAANRRQTRALLQHLEVWETMVEAGLEDVSPYDPANIKARTQNAADSMSLHFHLRSKMADLLERSFATRTADEWESELCEIGIPCVKIQSWQEWRDDPKARTAGIWTKVVGHDLPQLGRVSWLESAQPYPDLKACRRAPSLPERTTPFPTGVGAEPATRPLAGFTVVDLSNVLAGPNCGRVFAELGASVCKIDPVDPQHPPTITTTWAAEHGAGKRSIILDTKTEEGGEIMSRIVAGSDIVLVNKLEAQLKRMGTDRESLERLNPAAIGLQLAAHSGERRGPRHDYPGYDPALQGTTGIMVRFGPEGCPTFHGVASCVDYLCGYLGAWAGVTALVGRQRRRDGRGDTAVTSLATAASLTQLLLQQAAEPASARGPYASGSNAGERVYPVADGHVFAEGPSDLTDSLASLTVEEALEQLRRQGTAAVPIQTCRELADRHRTDPSRTVNFERRECDGWVNECFAPTWFAFDGEPVASLGGSPRVGSNGPEILAELGYSAEDIDRLVGAGVVGQTEWLPASAARDHPRS